MKKTLFAAAIVLAATVAAPAMAHDFTGPRIGVTVGLDRQNDHSGVEFGGVAGYDVRVLGPITAGAEVTVSDSTRTRSNLDIGVNGRLAFKVCDHANLFGTVGYARTNLEGRAQQGVRLGAGVEVPVTQNVYTTVGYTHTEYGNNVAGRDQVLAGLGVRF